MVTELVDLIQRLVQNSGIPSSNRDDYPDNKIARGGGQRFVRVWCPDQSRFDWLETW